MWRGEDVLIVVRHGRTANNAAGQLLGRLDPPLDETGVAQAAAVGRVLADLRVARVISSPLERARATAAAVADACGCGVDLDDRWIEMDYGTLDGTPITDVGTEVWDRWRKEPGFSPGGGESLEAVSARVAGACSELEDFASGANVVVVTHVSPLKAAVCWALGTDPLVSWRTFVSPGSITRIGVGGTGRSLRSFNELPCAGGPVAPRGASG